MWFWRRKKQFALLLPVSKTRFEIGINLKGQVPSGKLLPSGNAMCTHKININTFEEIDKEVIDWLKKAYENAGQNYTIYRLLGMTVQYKLGFVFLPNTFGITSDNKEDTIKSRLMRYEYKEDSPTTDQDSSKIYTYNIILGFCCQT